MGANPLLTIEQLIKESKVFCSIMSKGVHEDIRGLNDGKKVGTYIEHKFKDILLSKYTVEIGSSAKGIDLPGENVNTDIKTTSIVQPQSSCPFKSARQKIFGLGYNLLLFVYEKNDEIENNLKFLHSRFIDQTRTGDFQTTSRLNEIIDNDGNLDDIEALLIDRNLPVDEIELRSISEEILQQKPSIGYLTISNALQWRLQYSRVIRLEQPVDGVIKIYDD